ncbi:hypothetical protein [Aquipuribacter hungaricus]|uniref:Uncharacterized protein n=1 Tax=Aquipuribacter hungaricus TaxID=545624 RepID=A0ABV7WEV0_9MICO
MALATFLVIQALLVAVSVVLLRPGTDVLAARVTGTEVQRSDLRLVGWIVVGAAAVLLVGVALLVGLLHAVPLVVVSVVAGVGAEALARRVGRPGTQASLMVWLERTLLRTQDLGRAGGAQATRLGRDVTSRARRAGAGRAARRR